MNDFDFSVSQHIPFIDHHAIHWADVRRTRCLFYQRFQYQYPGPIYNLRQRLVVVPAQHHDTQQLRKHRLDVSPTPAEMRQSTDPFGNCVLELELLEVDRIVVFEVQMIVESDAHVSGKVAISAAEANRWLQPTSLTMPDDQIARIARQLQNEAATPHDLAQRISDWVYQAMRYQSGVTHVGTTAAEALMLGQGLCQDYAHLMLSMCRTAGLPARYVSGHLLGEGGSHAWVEVFLPAEDGLNAVAFDPTNNRHPYLDYITVAVGRDYRDISPTSGSFTAPYGGQLTCGKRAGLIRVEYLNGDILESQPIM